MAEYADEAIQKIKAAVEERKADQKAAKKARKSGILELINAAHAKNTQERLIHLSLMTPENLINELQKPKKKAALDKAKEALLEAQQLQFALDDLDILGCNLSGMSLSCI